MVRYLVATPLVIFIVLLVVGALTGRVQVRNCCSIADPSKDLRMTAGGPIPIPIKPDRMRVGEDSPLRPDQEESITPLR